MLYKAERVFTSLLRCGNWGVIHWKPECHEVRVCVYVCVSSCGETLFPPSSSTHVHFILSFAISSPIAPSIPPANPTGRKLWWIIYQECILVFGDPKAISPSPGFTHSVTVQTTVYLPVTSMFGKIIGKGLLVFLIKLFIYCQWTKSLMILPKFCTKHISVSWHSLGEIKSHMNCQATIYLPIYSLRSIGIKNILKIRKFSII